MPVGEFQKILKAKLDALKIDPAIVGRYVNEGFSGGEKKRAEILQMALLEPEIAIMDETDSGLDIDSVKVVADGILQMYTDANGGMGVLVITHYSRILQFLKPHLVHIMYDGRIVVSGGPELAEELEQHGYEGIRAAVRRHRRRGPRGRRGPARGQGVLGRPLAGTAEEQRWQQRVR